MKLTLRHLFDARRRRMNTDIRSGNFFDLQDGMVTIQYPQEVVPVPDNGRYRLHNEMDDCIVCDKCVKVCPVDCIEIEVIKATEEVGRASDGSPIRLYAAKFDIDMAKCCYCGLCTTVCPTESLTMTKTFDYSELDIRDMVYNFGNLTADEAQEKRELLEQFQKEKELLKAAQKGVTASEVTPKTPVARPAFKPTVKPKQEEVVAQEEPLEPVSKPKPVFQPRKPAPAEAKSITEENSEETKEKPAAKLPFKPSMKPKVSSSEPIEGSESESAAPVSKPAFRPTMKPKPADMPVVDSPVQDSISEPAPVAKPAFRPTMKPKPADAPVVDSPVPDSISEPAPVSKPAFRPTMKPKPADMPVVDSPVPDSISETAPVSKPAFRPTMKPKPAAPIVDSAQDIDHNLPLNDISEQKEESPKTKPAFRPTMKPKPKSDQE